MKARDNLLLSSCNNLASPLNGMAFAENSALPNYSDCVICGKRSNRFKMKMSTAIWTRQWSWARRLQKRKRRSAFLDGMLAGTFLLMPGACRRLPFAIEIGIVSHTITTALSQEHSRWTEVPRNYCKTYCCVHNELVI